MTEQERNNVIQEKLNEGVSLSDIQKILADEYEEKMTYFELRMLAADLEVNWEAQSPKKEEPEDVAGEDAELPTEDESDDAEEASGAGQTVVTVSKLVRPGAMMSGDVTFASGAKGEWMVDQLGRLGLNPAPGSSDPTPEDIQEFQVELQNSLAGQ